MLLKQNNPKVVRSILFTGLLTLLASCGNSSALEGMVRADPKLRESDIGQAIESSDEESLDLDTSASLAPATDTSPSEETIELEDNSPASNSSEDRAVVEEDAIATSLDRETSATSLPASFPPSFPIYPQANLKEVKAGKDDKSGMLTWTSSDNSKAIADYYQAELIANNWEIIKPFSFDSQGEIARAIAVKGDRRVHLNLLRSQNKATGNNGTKLSAIYEPVGEDVALSDTQLDETESQPDLNSQTAKSNLDSSGDKPQSEEKAELFPEVVRKKQSNLARGTIENDDYINSTDSDFIDLDRVSEPLMQPLETVAALGILTPYTQEGSVEVNKFVPNATITRGEYARWLIAANNLYHQGDPGKKIYLVNNTDRPAFQDVKPNHPDFGAIQGLAEAGLVPSNLTQDSTSLLFKPDAPLTREDLVTWKVPLDTRQALPQASIEALQESWGFQDAASIDSSGIRALYADYQNGDRSNVRRIFGFTTLFQPKKPVTRAEAAASLWYFGFQGDGVTAQEILELESQTESDS